MRRALNLVYDISGALAALFVLAIFVVMLGTSVMRTIGLRTGGFEEIIAWLTAAAAFTGLAHTFKHGDFVRVELLISRLSPGKRRIAEIFVLTIAATFVGYMAWSTLLYVLDSYRFQDMSTGLIAIPIWIPQVSFVTGSALLFIAMIDELCRVIAGRKASYTAAIEARHARGDFSADV